MKYSSEREAEDRDDIESLSSSTYARYANSCRAEPLRNTRDERSQGNFGCIRTTAI